MLRLIRVILSADVSQFSSGMSRAIGMLSGFLGAARNAFGGAANFVSGLVNTLAHLPDAFNTVTDAIEGLFGGALTKERTTAVFKSLTGDAAQAADMMEFLRQTSLSLGKDIDGLIPSAQQVAVALRASDGAIDPAKWEELTMAVVKFSTLRPDVPMELWGRAISGLLNGDVSTLTRLLDVDVRNLANLSQETRDFLEGANEVREQQLGRVTRLGADAASDRASGLDALREIMEAVGATDDLLQETANSTQGKLDQLKAQWEDFVDRLALELMPLLIEALDGLLKWITDHEEEINTFLENVGKTAKEVYDRLKEIDWEQIGKDLAKAGRDGEKAWNWLLGLLKTIGEAVDKLNELYGMLPGQNGMGLGDQAMDTDPTGSVVDALQGNSELQGPIGDLIRWLQGGGNASPPNANSPFHGGGPNGDVAPSLDFDVNINMNTDLFYATVDARARGVAVEALAEFVTSKGGGGQQPLGPRGKNST